MTDGLDPRLFAFRPDLAESALEGQVEAVRFSMVRPSGWFSRSSMSGRVPIMGCRLQRNSFLAKPCGFFDRQEGWAWVKNDTDSYVGYVSEAALANEAVQFHPCGSNPAHICLSGPGYETADPKDDFNG